jgi:hypothetical protein
MGVDEQMGEWTTRLTIEAYWFILSDETSSRFNIHISVW